MTTYYKKCLLIFLYLISLYGCTSTPTGVKPVSDFNINKYLGTWYEIARLDHSCEKDLIRRKQSPSLGQPIKCFDCL